MPRALRWSLDVTPGIVLCAAVTGVAYAIQIVEERVSGHPYVEALVLAILIGTLVRTIWTPGPRFKPGIAFSGKILLEIAVMFLGASLSAAALAAAGPTLLVGIAAVVAVALFASYGIGRLLGLPHKMALLIACGNSICGNSAIAAVASVIEADGDDVASSISFTAILGVIVVLSLPLLIPILALSDTQYGVLAGLTVYAVPQVLAATAPVGPLALQIGTMVKLVRVLLLGPVVFCAAIAHGQSLAATRAVPVGASVVARPPRLPMHKLIPWFIIGFVAFAVLRSLGLLPPALLPPLAFVTTIFTVLSMAALGLGVDLRVLSRVGGRATLVVTLSLLLLLCVSIALIRGLGVV
ncbi:YeiH family protein [Roseixanthobacter glucoisosaccharinicivorans]|uniref:YeiH family protein n=1 Tax=Roseixanthobacter glucoisosaccharinicivorans TaxID=3119923 RepID=UPI0037282022